MSSLKEKLYNYEANPPSNAWDKIAAALDDAENGDKYPGILQKMEVMPPAGAWDRINAALEQEESAVTTGRPTRVIPFLRYAAAALLIGAIAFAVLRWNNSSDTGKSIAAETLSQPKVSEKNNIPADQVTKDIPAIKDTDTDNLVVEAAPDKKLNVHTDKTVRTRRTSVPNNSSSDASTALYTYDDHVPSIADRYIMLMTPDGNFIRMSKKWSNMVCCVSGEEQDADCKDQLKKWQEKLAQSSISSGNFMDILSLVNSLDDGTEL